VGGLLQTERALSLRWTAGSAGDRVYVEIVGSAETNTCTFADESGAGTIPSSALPAQGSAAVSIHRLREATFSDLSSPAFWILVALVLAGAIAGNLRAVALSTTVTLLVPEDRRDRANGLVGTTNGLAFAITSVFSGLAVGLLGMGALLAVWRRERVRVPAYQS
jgi:MFS family permease